MALKCLWTMPLQVSSRAMQLKWQHFSLLLFILAISTISVVSAGTITSDRQTLLRRADCPAGQTFCDKFGCVAGIRCPHACAYFDSMQACDRIQVNGNKCVWWGSQCIPNVQCSMVNGQCSDDCNLCGVYGCVPRGNKCPQACEAFTNTNNCNQHLASNGINCQWNTQRNMCGYAVGATPLDQLQFSPSAIGGSASPAPNPLELLRMMRNNRIANSPSRSPDGIPISAGQMAALSGSPTAMPNSVAGNSAVTGGGEKLGSTSVDNAGSSNSANSATGIPSAKESNPSGTTATPNASSSPSPPNSSDNSSNNEAQDGNMLQTSSSGSIKIWGAFCGVAVALVAIAGIAFLVVQQRMRARRELLAEQRNAEMHNVHPEHRRESLLPYVQNVLGSNNAIQPPPAAVNH